jgi:EpsI family protein
MTAKLAMLSGLLIGGVAVIHGSVPETPQTNRAPFATLPATVGTWRSEGDLAIDEDSLKILKADDYVNRLYVQGNTGLDLFVAYYATQRQGDTMHSPMNCLPASGWQPMSTSRVQLAVAGSAPINANRVLIQKGLDKELVLYWYQSHGRTIASEYASRAYLVLDSIRRHRSDAALIRVITPAAAGEARATQIATDFVQSLRPLLTAHIPD